MVGLEIKRKTFHTCGGGGGGGGGGGAGASMKAKVSRPLKLAKSKEKGLLFMNFRLGCLRTHGHL